MRRTAVPVILAALVALAAQRPASAVGLTDFEQRPARAARCRPPRGRRSAGGPAAAAAACAPPRRSARRVPSSCSACAGSGGAERTSRCACSRAAGAGAAGARSPTPRTSRPPRGTRETAERAAVGPGARRRLPAARRTRSRASCALHFVCGAARAAEPRDAGSDPARPSPRAGPRRGPAIVPRSQWDPEQRLPRRAARRRTVVSTSPSSTTPSRSTAYSRDDAAAVVLGICRFPQRQRLARHRLQPARRPLRHRSTRAAPAASSSR